MYFHNSTSDFRSPPQTQTHVNFNWDALSSQWPPHHSQASTNIVFIIPGMDTRKKLLNRELATVDQVSCGVRRHSDDQRPQYEGWDGERPQSVAGHGSGARHQPRSRRNGTNCRPHCCIAAPDPLRPDLGVVESPLGLVRQQRGGFLQCPERLGSLRVAVPVGVDPDAPTPVRLANVLCRGSEEAKLRKAQPLPALEPDNPAGNSDVPIPQSQHSVPIAPGRGPEDPTNFAGVAPTALPLPLLLFLVLLLLLPRPIGSFARRPLIRRCGTFDGGPCRITRRATILGGAVTASRATVFLL